MKMIDSLVAKGETALTRKEQQKLGSLAIAVQKVEDESTPLPKPVT